MTTIRAIRTTENDVLELVEIPTPTVIEPFDILVRVKGIALNPGDVKVCIATSNNSDLRSRHFLVATYPKKNPRV